MSAGILIIDPDESHLERYRQALAPKAPAWALHTVTSTAAALEIAAATPPDIVVAPLRLDDGNGLKSLSQIVDLAPLAHAFIVAREEEKPQLAAAFEGGCRYLPDPCPADRLLLEFRRCLALDSWLENPVVQEVVTQRSQLASPPQLYLKIVAALKSPHASIATLSEAINTDMALVSKILETVNSSFYGFEERISDITHATSLLGLENLKNIALAGQVFDRVGKSREHRALVEEIWHHSAAVAIAARRIAQHETRDHKAAEEAYSAGLLHDIGKLVLLDAVPELYADAQRLSRESNIPPWRAELQTIGCDHAEIGAYLLSRWNLPSPVCEAAALHHRPANACQDSFTPLTAVHAANAVVRKRKNPKHLDATPNPNYLDEIGHADSWDAWQAVAIGEAPPRGKPKLAKAHSAKEPKSTSPTPQPTPAAKPPPPPPRDPTTRPEHGALAQALAAEQALNAEPSFSLSSKQTILLSFLAGILVCGLFIYWFLPDAAETETTDAPEDSPAANIATSASAVKERQKLFNDMLAEPTGKGPATDAAPPPPAPVPATPFPEIKLGGIFQRVTGPKAQVNGRIVAEGDTLNSGATIRRIGTTTIQVEHQGRVRTFALD